MPPDVCQLPLVGGHPALDLVNTLERGATSPHDFLSDPSALLRWSVLAGTINDVEAEQVGRACATSRRRHTRDWPPCGTSVKD